MIEIQNSKCFFFNKKTPILRTVLKDSMQKYAPRNRYSCPYDMNRSALERRGLGASFKDHVHNPTFYMHEL